MDRRKTLKTLLTGGLGAALVANTTSCESPAGDISVAEAEAAPAGYGMRLPHEIVHDQLIASQSFFIDSELETLGILGNIIAPGEEGEPKATETGLLEFLEFMALDQPGSHQVKLRGGLAWLNNESKKRYGETFAKLTDDQRVAIVDDIAYPEEAKGTAMEPGADFFGHMRYMTVTCYFTSKDGMRKALGYEGNMPNVWDGVPQEVLDKHGMAYDPKYLPMYVNQDRREEMAEWDADKNLINNS